MEEKQKEYRVPVYNGDALVGVVKYNENLDVWTGHNWGNGGAGRHLGITRLNAGQYVLIHGTNWESEYDYGEVVSPRQALDQIIVAGAYEILEEDRFKDLKELMDTLPHD